jgi:hypothetical protein
MHSLVCVATTGVRQSCIGGIHGISRRLTAAYHCNETAAVGSNVQAPASAARDVAWASLLHLVKVPLPTEVRGTLETSQTCCIHCMEGQNDMMMMRLGRRWYTQHSGYTNNVYVDEQSSVRAVE